MHFTRSSLTPKLNTRSPLSRFIFFENSRKKYRSPVISTTHGDGGLYAKHLECIIYIGKRCERRQNKINKPFPNPLHYRRFLQNPGHVFVFTCDYSQKDGSASSSWLLYLDNSYRFRLTFR